jgi:hypothetical protein
MLFVLRSVTGAINCYKYNVAQSSVLSSGSVTQRAFFATISHSALLQHFFDRKYLMLSIDICLQYRVSIL